MMYGFTFHRIDGERAEDFYLADKNKKIIAVADGVHRDWDEELRKEKLGNYPNPSPARIASEIFCKTFCSYLSDKSPSEKIIRDAFLESNRNIYGWNKENIPNSDYLINDFAGCVAAGIAEKDGWLYWGFLADSGIAILNKTGDLEFRTKDEGPQSKEKNPFLEPIVDANGGWQNPKARKIIRSVYRNNPHEKFAYGVLTGEPEAMHYVKTGRKQINNGDYVLVYSDDLIGVIFEKDGTPNLSFTQVLLEDNIEKLKGFCKDRIKTEGTLVVFKKE